MFYSEKHNVVVYQVKDPATFLKYVPQSGTFNDNHVFAPATLETFQAIRAVGLPVLPILDREYDWPHGPHIKAPMISQKLRANFLAVHPRAFDLSDPGTGKTLCALWAADAMMQRARDRFRAIIVAPLSSLIDTWQQEIYANFLNRRSCVVLHGSAEKRLKLLNENVDFYIINHDGVGVGVRRDPRKGFVYEGFAAALRERRDIRLAIIDEAGAYRDAATRRSRLARTLLSSRDYVWLLTGTPTPNGPEDAHGLKKLQMPGWPETFASWRSRTMIAVDKFPTHTVWKPRIGAAQLVKDTLQPAVRATLDECIELPPMITQTREATLTAEQLSMLRELKRELLLQTKNGATISAVNAAALRIKFLQIVSGAVYDDLHAAHKVPCGPRIAVLREIIEESNDKLILFAPFTSVVSLLSTTLKEYTHAVITGAVGFKERTEIFSSFRRDRDPRLLIADPRTMSHSLNLTVCPTVVWYAPIDNTETYLQANRRIRRPGQTRTQRVVHIVGHRVEREIYRRVAENSNLMNVVLGLIQDSEL